MLPGLPRASVSGDELATLCARVDDWPRLLHLLRQHRVEALVAGRLLALPEQALPASARRALVSLREASTVAALGLAAESRRVLDAFAARDLRVIPIKGATLALQAYGDLSARRPGDIDLLIRPDDLADADALLMELGYQRLHPRVAPDAAFRPLLLRSRNDVEYRHPTRAIRLELHWRWMRNPYLLPVAPGALSGSAGTTRLGNADVPCVDNETLFAYLCVHGAHHRWQRFMWLNDLRHLLASPRHAPDGARLRRLASDANVAFAVTTSLALLESVTGVAVPDWAASTPARRSRRARHALTVWRDALAGAHGALRVDGAWRELIEEWRLVDGWRARALGLLWHRLVLPSENDFLSLPLPRRWHGLYPILRPFLWWRRRRLRDRPD